MTLYRCLAVSDEGRADWRVVEAPNEAGAVSRLAAAGLTSIEVRTGKPTLAERLNQPVRLPWSLGLAEQSLILTQLALLVRSALPLDQSLDLLRDQAPRAAQREAIGEVLARVRSGSSLASAIEERGIFPAYVVGAIRSAERGGRLGSALTSVAERMSETSATRRRLVTALTYPAAVLAATFIALFLVLTQVVPQFEPVFAGEEARLPALTRFVVAFSNFASESWPILLGLLVGVPILLWAFLRSAAAGRLIGSRRLPGRELRDQYLAGQFMGVLGTLLRNGVPVLGALPLASSAIGSERWRLRLATVERRVREGESLSRALARVELVPRTAIRLMEVGERSGQLAGTCEQASAVLGDAARARIERIVSLANPIAIVLLGGVVALLIAGVMLGIFAIGEFGG
jgi:type II secretory pathway component PulF